MAGLMAFNHVFAEGGLENSPHPNSKILFTRECLFGEDNYFTEISMLFTLYTHVMYSNYTP